MIIICVCIDNAHFFFVIKMLNSLTTFKETAIL